MKGKQMKLHLQATDEDTNSSVLMSTEVNTWYEALDYFVKFLRANGYGLHNDSVGINKEHHFLPEDEWFGNITSFNKGV